LFCFHRKKKCCRVTPFTYLVFIEQKSS
jgi:hypothetical protein